MISSQLADRLAISAYFLLVAIAALPPFVPGLFLLGGLSVLDPLIGALAVVLITQGNTLSRSAFLQAMFIALIGLLALLSAVSNSASGLDGSAIGVGLRYIYFAFLVLTIPSIAKKKDDLKLLASLTFILLPVLLLIWAWSEWFASPRHIFGIPMLHLIHEDVRVTINRNYLGFFISIAAAFSFSYSVENFKLSYRSVFLLLATIFLFVSVFLTFSKGAWLAALVGAIAPYWIKNIRYLVVTFFALVAMGAVFLLAFPEQIDEIIEVWVAGSSIKNFERFDFAIQGLILAGQNPLLGVGPGNYEMATIASGFIRTSDPHNAIVWVSAELGIVAGLLFVTALVSTFYNVRRARRFEPNLSAPLLAGFIALLLNIPIHGLPASMRYFYILCGCVLAVLALERIASRKQTGRSFSPRKKW